MGRKVFKILIAVWSCWLTACVKDKPQTPTYATLSGNSNVYVVCEGNFGNGDASLYLYNRDKDSAYGDVYTSANNQPLGDVFQSMIQIGNHFFLCINNSDKVLVIDTGSRKLIASISIPKPRYVLPISATKAYVSAEYSNKVYVINPQTYTITGTIELPYKNPEGMYLHDNAAYVCTWDTACNSLFKIDIATDKVTQTIKVSGYAPQAVLADKEQMLWVLAGNQTEGKTATLTRVDPSTGEILASYLFPAKADALKPVFNTTGDTLYFIEVNYYGGTANNGIYRMPVTDQMLPVQPFVAAQQYQYFWALGIDPATGYIYVGDPKGFTQKGSVEIYKQDGALMTSFNVGIGPGHFYF